MYEKCRMELKMKRNLLLGGEKDKTIYETEILSYNEEKEEILSVLKNGSINEISLDGFYEGKIFMEEDILEYTGVLKERYINKDGSVVRIRVQDGFYKKRIN